MVFPYQTFKYSLFLKTDKEVTMKYVAWIMCTLLLLSTVSALYGISYDTYSGQAARLRRADFDPYSRERYYGEGQVQTFGDLSLNKDN